eukprot:1166244-Rhodomonas_salina.2
MSGTDLGYDTMQYPLATVLRDIRYWHRLLCYALFGTDLGYGATSALSAEEIGNPPPHIVAAYLGSYALATRCPGIVLRACYTLSGANLAYAVPCYARATRCPVLTCVWCYEALRHSRILLPRGGTRLPILLCACYSLSGTDRAYDAHGAMPLLCDVR